MNRFTIELRDDEQAALYELALRERRHVKGQAAECIRRELERAGLLKSSAHAEPCEAVI